MFMMSDDRLYGVGFRSDAEAKSGFNAIYWLPGDIEPRVMSGPLAGSRAIFNTAEQALCAAGQALVTALNRLTINTKIVTESLPPGEKTDAEVQYQQ